MQGAVKKVYPLSLMQFSLHTSNLLRALSDVINFIQTVFQTWAAVSLFAINVAAEGTDSGSTIAIRTLFFALLILIVTGFPRAGS
jgi:hypothetical protein